jgi:hypothetical protein
VGRLDQEEDPQGPLPRLSVIVACRDEERSVEGAARSLLAQDYPDLEVVAVDDRSRDATGRILDALATEDPRLRVLHVGALPPGFLGKTHACHAGAAAATGSVLLFTDADVFFERAALRKAVGFLLRHGLGHLSVMPRLIAPHFLERGFVSACGLLGTAKLRLWTLGRPRSAAFIGVGAFNLVRREAYVSVGGHARVAFEVVEDLKLGMVLRRSGVRQGALDSGGLVRVRWNTGFRGTVLGLMKNAFAGVEWRWSAVVVAATGTTLLVLAPWVALLWGSPGARLAGALGVLTPCLLHAGAARRMADGTGLEGLAYPVCDLSLVLVLLGSALKATVEGGIVWRGTFYPLPALRAGCVREGAFSREGAVGWE